MQKLQQERLVVAMAAQAGAEIVLEDTIKYCKERHAFGKPISKFQNTSFKLAECATKVEVGRAFIDRLDPDELKVIGAAASKVLAALDALDAEAG